MELTPRRHELLCTYLLGIGTLFLYTGYSLQQFIGESVIHSIHEKSPDTISAYAGYYGRLLVFIIGFLIGFSDFCVTMARAVICQVAVPDCRMQVFSLSKLYQSGSSVVVLLLTPYMTIYIWLCVLTVFLFIGTFGFVIVARRTAADRQKHSVAHPSQAQLADKI
ncbi:hypothetical protein B9Z55_012989 [Caenorhabditis nigoni]|uniref:Uncharacterized protein n=1 Tax=Caenorhabditis nigoni TaxID=1611254 RepID=A0A2G5TZQ0_9PELO|nr:hypothetical protein B9Z55_012989 [Caenorhabditis nigoni]